QGGGHKHRGRTNSKGAAGRWVEMKAVTATRSPDGTAETKIQRPMISQPGLDAVVALGCGGLARAGVRSISTPQAAIRTKRTRKPPLHRLLCSRNVKTGSNTKG